MPKRYYTLNSPQLLVVLFCLFSAISATAQDLHYSQFYLNPQHLNPALTGVFAGEWRAGGMYRSQWESVPVQYRTGAAWADFKAYSRRSTLVGVGVLAQYDRAGDARLNWTQAGINASVVQGLNSKQALSVGFGLAFAQRSIDMSGLSFKNQWDGDTYNPALPSKEPILNNTGFTPSLSAGLNWHYALSGERRTQIDAGIGAFHLNGPDLSFQNDQQGGFQLDPRLTFYTHAVFQWQAATDIVCFALRENMNFAQETLLGGGLRYWLSNTPGNQSAVRFTMAYRLKDAIIPAIQIERNEWTVGLSYDWNTSPFQIATSNRGGFELGLVYRSQPAPPLKVAKVCPIF